ncbi:MULTISPECIES: SLC13 family permease [unclassified Enterococcus]|uniref:SLC13 family permease n=1 Tax=unclassified Enterococcus TaxID=2608891 RepID=UPI001555C90B|nr:MULTISPECIES: SLC13 family permease [unclassified Enterococcus]MBS7577447.1 carboxylate transporter [Enterococcus sp. MMGLQ5-2]MBS7584854.1 carboxylate transporter [Enterococcus sp. MMGLQ5-1]NPD12709.1 carboxylate transporter [Enterococcus sp. MMGLQ5-1]NPD37281.1 carboxylate transporter [Enterococcus sp. MMGLQ5-2]
MLLKRIFHDRILIITFIIVLFLGFFKLPKMADIDLKTIISLLNLLFCVKIMENKGYLNFLAYKISKGIHSSRQLTFKFAILSFFCSMLVTNDIAILTLIPIFLVIANLHQMKKIYPITLITIAANLGSAVTPFGNPQNLYLYNHFDVSLREFFAASAILGSVSLLLLLLFTLFAEKLELGSKGLDEYRADERHAVLFLITLLIAILGILSIIPIWLSLTATICFILCDDKKVIFQIDYSLIFIFIGFFFAVSSLKQIPFFTQLISAICNGNYSTYFTTILVSQLISNVPAAVLMSSYSSAFLPVFLGANVGGLGTMIASLANLLALKQYNKDENADMKEFVVTFSKINFLLLILLGGIMLMFF